MRLHVFLLYALLVSNVVFRLFTNKLGILPKAFNITDVVITLWLVLLSLRYTAPRSGQGGSFSFGGRLVAFNLDVCGIVHLVPRTGAQILGQQRS